MNQIYTASIQNTSWIDLSDSHRQLRETLENRVQQHCVEGRQVNALQVKGAFRIGKSQLLYYMFHYAWRRLGVPAFYLKLEQVVDILAEACDNGERLSKERITPILNDYFGQARRRLAKALETSDSGMVHLPDIRKDEPVTAYFARLGAGQWLDGAGQAHALPAFELDAIRTALRQPNYLLLVDEFEEAYFKVDQVVQSGGGGAFRQFFEDIAKHQTDFFMIAACGPASGLEINSRLGDSRAAQNGRIQSVSLPFPDIDKLRTTYLKDHGRGHANFMWWLSRRRPGWIKKLNDELDVARLDAAGFDQAIDQNRAVFDQAIDGQGLGDVRLLNYGAVKARLSDSAQLNACKRLLVDLRPQAVDVKASAALIESMRDELYFAARRCAAADAVDALVKDISAAAVKRSDMNGAAFDPGNYLRIYLGKIFSALSDDDEQVVLGLADESQRRSRMAQSFLAPLLGMVYDFLAEYEDETDAGVAALMKLVHGLAHDLQVDSRRVGKWFGATSRLFQAVYPDEVSRGWMQLNLKALREVIEQPVGSPVIAYQDQPLTDVLSRIDLLPAGLIEIQRHVQQTRVTIWVVPDVPAAWRPVYMKRLQRHLANQWDQFDSDGQWVGATLFLGASASMMAEHQQWFDRQPAPFSRLLNKYTLLSSEDMAAELTGHMAAFVDSMSKIGLIGRMRQEIATEDGPVIDFQSLVEQVVDPAWTRRKEMRRTIGYYRELTAHAVDILADNQVAAFHEALGEHIDLDQFQRAMKRVDRKDSGHIRVEWLAAMGANAQEILPVLNELAAQWSQLSPGLQTECTEAHAWQQAAAYIQDHPQYLKRHGRLHESTVAQRIEALCERYAEHVAAADKLPGHPDQPSPIERLLRPLAPNSGEPVERFLRIRFLNSQLGGLSADACQAQFQAMTACQTRWAEQIDRLEALNIDMKKQLNRRKPLATLDRIKRFDHQVLRPLTACSQHMNTALPAPTWPLMIWPALAPLTQACMKNMEAHITLLSQFNAALGQVQADLTPDQEKFDALYHQSPMHKALFDETMKDSKQSKNFYTRFALPAIRKNKAVSNYLKQGVDVFKDAPDTDLETHVGRACSAAAAARLHESIANRQAAMETIDHAITLMQTVMADLDPVVAMLKQAPSPSSG